MSVDNSILENLRRQRQEIEEDKTKPVDIDVEGYEGNLFIRHRYVPYEDMKVSIDKVMKQKKGASRDVAAAAQVMIQSTEAIMIRVGEGEAHLSGDPDMPMGFDQRLTEALEFKADTAREIVLGLFGNDDYLLFNHAAKVSRWIRDRKTDLDAEFTEVGNL